MTNGPIIRPAPKPVRWFLILSKADGVTIPPIGIFIKEEFLTDHKLVKHESKHWEQYQNMGFFKFYITYFWYYIRFGYENHPMELEARQAENH